MVATELTPLAHLARRAGWILFAVLIGTHVMLAVPLGGERSEVMLSWGLGMVPMAMSAIGSWVVFARVRGEERRFWGLLAVATTLLFWSELYFVYWVLRIDPLGPQLPHPFELVQTAAALAFFALVMSLTRFGAEPFVVRVRYYLDIVAVVVVGYAVVYRFVLDPHFAEIPRRSLGLVLVGSAYPVLGTVMIVATFGTLVGFKAFKWRAWERFVALAVTIYSLGILGWPWWYLAFQTAAEPKVIGSILEYIFTIGHYLLFMAVVYRLTERDAEPVPRMVRAPVDVPPHVAAVIPGALAVAVPVIAASSLTATGSEVPTVTLTLALALACVLVVRSWLVTVERSHLLERSVRDSLTGMRNRRAFETALCRIAGDRSEGPIAVVAFDIDGFKRLNEIGGHAQGDRVLKEVATIVTECVALEADRAFRLSGDDLLVLVPDADLAHVRPLVRQCVDRVSEDVSVAGLPVSLTAGIALYTGDVDDPETALRHALSAQRWAKSHGTRVASFDDTARGVPGERTETAKDGAVRTLAYALSTAIDSTEPGMDGHSRSVADVAVRLAKEMGFGPGRVRAIEVAALLHDVGKLAQRHQAEDPADAADRSIADDPDGSAHAAAGEHFLRTARMPHLIPWVRAHHEQWDGRGGPDGLIMEAIPLEARIIAVADAFDALRRGRDSAGPLGHHGALRALELEAGRRFDPTVVHALVKQLWPAEDLFARRASGDALAQ